MFSLKVIDTDEFLDMPPTTQNLYFHLGLRADDDGFIPNPKKITKMINSSDDDMKILIAKQFIIPFESGVCVIRHWRIHNLIRKDRYTETEYKEEKRTLKNQDNKYLSNETKQDVIPNGNQMATTGMHRLGKVSIGKDRLEEDSIVSYTEKDKFLTDLLYKLVKQNYQFLKEKNYSKDYAEMNRLNRIDKWSYEQIEYIIKWSQNDNFWKQNIRSVSKLRKQFENLIVRAKENTNQVIKT